nr:helix-turn-helix transcriptional regulator [uncultured Anaerotignum sp.]
MGLEKINDMRKHIGMSIDELSEKSGVPKGTLSKITAGITKNPSIDTVKAIVHTMGFTLDDLDDFPRSKSGNDLSAENMELLKKYSNLDAHGKKIVDFVLNEESERSNSKKGIPDLMYDDYELSSTIQKAAQTPAPYTKD